jgi:hypothetical protein
MTMQARISKPVKSPMQSGERTKGWILEFVRNEDSLFKESLMGRTSSKDTMPEVVMSFDNMEHAIEFAQKNGYAYEVIPSNIHKMKKKSYTSNFTN